MVTVKDIARRLGVSPSTVARALGDHPRISHATKARVRSAAEDLGYVADGAARLMRGQASTLLGLLVPDIQNEFYATLAKAISECCDDFGFQLLLSITNDDPEVELRQVRGLLSARAAGAVVILTPDPLEATVGLLARLSHVQLIRRCRKVASPWFGIDDVAATREATQHLLDLGHRRIAYVGGSTAISTGAERVDGFHQAFDAAGVDRAQAIVEAGGCDADYGRIAAERVLHRPLRPTAMITGGARITIGALEALRANRIGIPADLSFIGFSDAAGFGWCGPGLTTIGLPAREIAQSCTTFLLRRARGRRAERPDEPPHQAKHMPFLIRRGSTAPPR